jgi:Protein of unknown function (DUF732)
MTSTQMRKPSVLLFLLTVAVVPAAGLLGVLNLAPSAHAVGGDDSFLAAIKSKGINYESPDTAIKSGHLVCDKLDSGEAPEQVANDIIQNGKLDSYHAGFFVGVSIRAYCPKYAQQ